MTLFTFKGLYTAILAASIFLLILGSIVCIAYPREESFAAQLEARSDKWQIQLDPNDKYWNEQDHRMAKELLLTFLRNNHVPTKTGFKRVGILLAIIAFFSGLGLYREKCYQKLKVSG